ncbi:MAG: GAF domain-containing protein [Cytophagia bacterium]|nr:MAG: GAF domain-containing protein [Cytophagales bacterium]TAG01466.1 MAG: GAF domain-containing protein [Cytophagia bacterium]TAG39168.1 MAG: GAF domain-containing protein [Cytophagia bacterium]
MAETLLVTSTTKQEKYIDLIPQLKSLLENETDLIANLANTAAALRQTFGFFWVGFYVVKQNQLILAPFQGDIACTRIPFHKGVCGACYTQAKTIIVPDVEKFEGHIACSSLSKSEIVVPIIKNNEVVAVLDVDSDELDDFSEIDKKYLEEIVNILTLSF